MTPQELAEFRELAGLNTPNTTQQNKEWADKQIKQTMPPPPVNTPLDNLAMRLNGLMTKPGVAPKIEMEKEAKPDPNLDGLADRLNSLLGSNNFKVERLN